MRLSRLKFGEKLSDQVVAQNQNMTNIEKEFKNPNVSNQEVNITGRIGEGGDYNNVKQLLTIMTSDAINGPLGGGFRYLFNFNYGPQQLQIAFPYSAAAGKGIEYRTKVDNGLWTKWQEIKIV